MNNTSIQSPLAGKQRKIYLDIARTVAIISISLNHAVNRTYENSENQYEQFLESSVVSTFIKTFTTVFSHIGVPLFLMITGVLILNKTFESGKDLKKFYKNNYIPIFITTEIWYFIMFWFITVATLDSNILQIETFISSVFECIKTMLFIDQTTLGSMWYMPMILCLYFTLPFWAVIVKKFPKQYILLPVTVSYLFFMVLPLLNQQMLFMEKDRFSTALNASNLPSAYMVYILLGYYVNKGLFAKIKDWQVLLLAISTFLCCCGYQWYAYSQPRDYLVGYNFPLLPVTAAFIFEFIRRKAHCFKKFSGMFAYISKISFGIYFVHVVIMQSIIAIYDFAGWRYPVKMLFLEVVSVGGSILIIALLSKIKIFKKYLFMVKD